MYEEQELMDRIIPNWNPYLNSNPEGIVREREVIGGGFFSSNYHAYYHPTTVELISNTTLKIQLCFTYQLYGWLKVYTTALSRIIIAVMQLASLES